MTRNELITQIRSEVSSFPNTQIEQGVWTNEEFNNAMVAAYNRAIDDALNCHSQYGDGLWAVNVEELQKLKVG